MEAKKGAHSAEFMLKEYERISGLWSDENRQAEQRVNFFLTLISAATGVIILIFQSSTLPLENIYGLAIGVLFVLLLFGMTILNRLLTRNVQVRALNQSLTEIQDYFAEKDPEVARYLKKQRNICQDREQKFKFISTFMRRLAGGLTSIVILANGLICGGIAWLLLLRSGYAIQQIALWAAPITIFSILILYVYSFFLRKNLPVWKFY